MSERTKINFIIPDFLNVDECTYLLSTFRNHNEVFKEGINIIGFTGMFPGCVWNKKDKKFDMYIYDLKLVKDLKDKYLSLNTSLILVFDKEEVSASELDDEYANELIKIFNNKKNYVIAKSKRLRNYIKDNYKEIRLIDYFDNRDSESSYVILSPENNRSIDESIDKNKVILQPDLGFIGVRKNMFKHSKKDSVLNPINPKKDKYYSKEDNLSFSKVNEEVNYLSYEEIVSYSRMGFNTYMLSGFGVYNFAIYENIIDYLCNEEYKMDQRISIYNYLFQVASSEQEAIYNYRI